jgi:uncharacterized membrane protein YhiD involved in acid resistance
VLNSVIAGGVTVGGFLICLFSAIALGVLTALVFTYKTKHTSSLAMSLAIMPAAVALVIMMVNGNIGAGVAVAGAFTLVRFRSVPGTAKEVAGLFVAMAIGLACGMGYVAVAGVFFVVMAVFVLVLSTVQFGEDKGSSKQLKITIPENLDYDELFDDLFEKYTKSSELQRIKTTNMGTLYELTYDVTLNNDGDTKAFLDELRCRNGNLNIVLGRVADKELTM